MTTEQELTALKKEFAKQIKKVNERQDFLIGIVSDFLRKLNTGVVPASDEPMLKISELAEKLNISQRFIRYEIEKGLPSHNIGGAKRFLYSEIIAYFKMKDGEKQTEIEG